MRASLPGGTVQLAREDESTDVGMELSATKLFA